MKKKIAASLMGLLVCIAVSSQVDPHAIGGRIGGGDGFGVEFSYQHGFSSMNRLELDLGAGGNSHYSRIGVTGIYHWVWNLGNEGLNWFVGPGGGFSVNTGKDNGKNGDYDDYFGMAIGGQIGLGFNFKFPLQLTIDTRPMFDVLSGDDADAFGWGFALGARYRF